MGSAVETRRTVSPPDFAQPGSRPRVLILGGGFTGIGAARKLKKADADVTHLNH